MAVKISTGLPNCREGRQNTIGSVTLEGMLRVARLADDLGYHALWPNEFFTTRPDVAARFGRPAALFDTIVTMAYVASATRRIRLTPSTIVLPLHEPLLLSRQLATLDVYSGGRITLGIGLGGSAEEFRQLHGEMARPNRGKMMDEYVPALRALWTQPKAKFTGQTVAFEEVETFPKPLQEPLPIFMAGHAEGVFRRLAEHGQGWIDSTQPPDQIHAHTTQLYALAGQVGRPEATFEIARQFYVSIAATEDEARAVHAASVPPLPPGQTAELGRPAPAGQVWERSLIGTPEHIRERLHAYVDAGVTELCAIFYYPDAESAERQLKLFADARRPLQRRRRRAPRQQRRRHLVQRPPRQSREYLHRRRRRPPQARHLPRRRPRRL
ncbi:MAG: LLM class flavin-dependent oxidoreductase [Chloroflexi bacterium]|nr:LLM class flavin-dependent oxidoreductase [Chloroflexota bacterium]